MFRSLYARISAVLVGVLCATGVLYIAITLYSTRLYQEQVDQKLNRTLAHNLVTEKGLTLHDGRFNKTLLKEIFSTYMAVNPSIEVYLLDSKGHILAYSAPPGKVKRTRVDLGPVYGFLDHKDMLPIVGDDPRDPAGRKIFSVAPIGPSVDPDGYLYVILGGEHLDSVADLLQSNLIGRLSVTTVIASLTLGVLFGLVLFHLLTRRLRRLDTAMAAFQASDFEDPAAARALDLRSQDEVGRLGHTFQQMAERITAQVQALKQTDNLRRELVANVSHDLRTPIASLQGYLETLLLKDGTLSADEKRHYVEVAIKHSERLGQLVTELFELAKLDSGQTRLSREAFAIGDLVQDIVMKFQLQAERRDITLTAEVPGELPLVDADIALIERVLENLLDNALRHTRPGGKVQVSLQCNGSRVGVKVADNGAGIDDQDLPHVFDRFYQAHNGKGESAGAAGLGLAIAKRILDLHDSPIRVASHPDSGTCFDFHLPVAPAAAT
ncbi:MAG: HAMP domain-containing sensor histidine kinase [Gammaproteobacteria bacterium]